MLATTVFIVARRWAEDTAKKMESDLEAFEKAVAKYIAR